MTSTSSSISHKMSSPIFPFTFKLSWSVFWYMRVRTILTDEHRVNNSYSFPVPVVTKHHKLGGLKATEKFPPYPGIQMSKIKVSAGLLSPRGSEQQSVSCFSPGVCWLPATSDILYVLLLFLRLSPDDLPSVSVSCHFLSPTRTPVIGCRAHPDSGWSRLEILIYLCEDAYSK